MSLDVRGETLAAALRYLLFALLPAGLFDLIAVGHVPTPGPIASAWAGPFGWGALAKGLVPALVMAALVLAFGPWRGRSRPGPLGWRGLGAAAQGWAIERLDSTLRGPRKIPSLGFFEMRNENCDFRFASCSIA
ncbi:MAG: hypothetical protein MUC77_20360 [Chromatiaceae bacterium]|nr:hypothetical protein [Chromatiaceae bacterium]